MRRKPDPEDNVYMLGRITEHGPGRGMNRTIARYQPNHTRKTGKAVREGKATSFLRAKYQRENEQASRLSDAEKFKIALMRQQDLQGLQQAARAVQRQANPTLPNVRADARMQMSKYGPELGPYQSPPFSYSPAQISRYTRAEQANTRTADAFSRLMDRFGKYMK